MAICDWCNKDMSDPATETCTGNEVVESPDGVTMPSLTDHYDEESGRCHYCNIKHGGFHHPGCDAEKCPRCGEQLMSCDCWAEDDE
jgi:hypothetical protein